MNDKSDWDPGQMQIVYDKDQCHLTHPRVKIYGKCVNEKDSLCMREDRMKGLVKLQG